MKRKRQLPPCADGVAIAAGDAAAVDAVTELNLEAKEPKLQCLPSGRGTTAVTNDHDGVAKASLSNADSIDLHRLLAGDRLDPIRSSRIRDG